MHGVRKILHVNQSIESDLCNIQANPGQELCRRCVDDVTGSGTHNGDQQAVSLNPIYDSRKC